MPEAEHLDLEDAWASMERVLGKWDVLAQVDGAPPTLTGSDPSAVRLSVGRDWCDYDAWWLTRPQVGAVPRAVHGRRRLVVAPKITPVVAEQLRGIDVDHVDLAGNVDLRIGGSIVVVRTTTKSSGASPNPHAPLNLFTPARAKVVATLLSWPELAEVTIHALAAHAGASDGQTHETVAELKRRGYLHHFGKDGWRLVEVDDLVDGWAAAYPTGLRPKILLGTFHSDLQSWRDRAADDADRGVVLGGEFSAREFMVPQTVAVYVSEVTPGLRKEHRLAPALPARRANTTVLQKFWTIPSDRPGSSAPWVIDYAELMTDTDSRVREAAGWVRNRAQ